MTPAVLAGPLPPDTPHVPVAIVGAGACGLTAALMLSDAGVDCVLLERDAAPSGSTALSSGFIPAAGTRVQIAAGITDSPERFAADIQAKAHGSAASHLVAAYTQAIAPAIDALQAPHGIEFVLLDGFLYPGHSTQRMHAVPEKTGVGLMTRLQQAVANAQVPVIGDALVRELWIDRSAGAPRVQGLGYQPTQGLSSVVGVGNKTFSQVANAPARNALIAAGQTVYYQPAPGIFMPYNPATMNKTHTPTFVAA